MFSFNYSLLSWGKIVCRNLAQDNPSYWHKALNNPENKLLSILNPREVNAIFPICHKAFLPFYVVTCSVEFLATQHTSMDLLMGCLNNEYLRDTRCKPNSYEPESLPVIKWSMCTSSVIPGPTLSTNSCLDASNPHELSFLISWQSRWFIGSFIHWTFLSSYCVPIIVLSAGHTEERIRI